MATMNDYDPTKSDKWNVAQGRVITMSCRDCGWQLVAQRLRTAKGFMALHENLNSGHRTELR